MLRQRLHGLQGSGWGWLGAKPVTGKLFVVTSGNQDTLSHVAQVWLSDSIATSPLDACQYAAVAPRNVCMPMRADIAGRMHILRGVTAAYWHAHAS